MANCIRWTLLALALALLAPQAVLAHGGGVPQLVDAPAGPYHVYAWTSPNPPRVGTLHVTVALVDPATDQPVTGVDVQVQVTPAPGSAAAPITARATHDQATIKAYYETDFRVPEAGPWQVTISYDALRGKGSAGFELAVKEKSFSNWLLVGGVALAIVVVGWFLWPAQQRAENGHRMSRVPVDS